MKEKLKKNPLIGKLASLLRDWREKRKTRLENYKIFSQNRDALRRNIDLKDSFKNRRCFILATGPSVLQQDLRKLAGEFCISVSNFFVHPDFSEIRPQFHVFAQSHDPITEDDMEHWLRDSEKHFFEGQKVVISAVDKVTVDKRKLLAKQKVYFYVASQDPLSPLTNVDFTMQTPFVKTIVQQAIYLAMYCGSTEIYLLGCEHNWITGKGGEHFYSENESTLMQRLKQGKKYANAQPSTAQQLNSYTLLWKRYAMIKEYADKHAIKIYNTTPGSLLDVFPKVSLEEVVR